MSVHSAHVDTFANDNLPPRDQWPDLIFTLPELQYPERMNCIVELLDTKVQQGYGDRPAIFSARTCSVHSQNGPRRKSHLGQQALRDEPRHSPRRRRCHCPRQ